MKHKFMWPLVGVVLLLLCCGPCTTLRGAELATQPAAAEAPAPDRCPSALCGTLPAHTADTLRILGVGNSFTDDGMMYLPELLEAAGIREVVLGRLYYPGCSLEQHCRFYDEEAANYIYYKSTGNKWATVNDHATLVEALEDERWDIVVLQQASHFSGRYETYGPWLDQLIGIVLSHNSNPALCLAWQMTWAYAQDSDHGGFAAYGNDQQQMYRSILQAVQRLQRDYDLQVIIPTGTAIQNVRGTLLTHRDATRDGYHLDLGIGRYTAACTWFEALIAPILGGRIPDDGFLIPHKDAETTPVYEAEAVACRMAAAAAVRVPFAISPATR